MQSASQDGGRQAPEKVAMILAPRAKEISALGLFWMAIVPNFSSPADLLGRSPIDQSALTPSPKASGSLR